MRDFDQTDSVLRTLGSRGRFQLYQLMVVSLAGFTGAYQLYNNIFIGRDIPFRCAPPPPNATGPLSLDDVSGNSSASDVRFDECEIVVSANVSGNVTSEERFDCVYGYQYDWDQDASFVSEFGLVCDSYLLVSLSQTFVVLGQGIGAFVASIISDRFGRKFVLVGSQLGLLVVGVAIGSASSFPLFTFFKCVVGMFQQGVVTSVNTMGIELFPREQRSLCGLIVNLWWAIGACTMAPIAYFMRYQSWRHLQYALSSLSLVLVIVHFFYVEESLRWLLANGKEKKVLHVLRRAARTNNKDLDRVLAVLRQCNTGGEQEDALQRLRDVSGSPDDVSGREEQPEGPLGSTRDKEGHQGSSRDGVEGSLHLEATRKLTLLDMFQHKRLLANSFIIFLAWFTVAFVVFTLYMMSTTYAGDPYINYFLTAFMEVPPSILLYFGVDRLGRKRTTQGFYAIAGIGCIASAVCRVFQGNPVLGTMSAVFAMVGMIGGSGAFGAVFFYTPELFPTNFRNQALGTGSTVGRIGGMIAPFMKNLSLLAVWGPGLITGSLCTVVVFCLRFLPETRGRSLPTEIEDVEAWYITPKPTHNSRQQNGEMEPVLS